MVDYDGDIPLVLYGHVTRTKSHCPVYLTLLCKITRDFFSTLSTSPSSRRRRCLLFKQHSPTQISPRKCDKKPWTVQMPTQEYRKAPAPPSPSGSTSPHRSLPRNLQVCLKMSTSSSSALESAVHQWRKNYLRVIVRAMSLAQQLTHPNLQ